MKTISFKEFINDYREYYNDHNKCFSIKTEEDMEEVIYDIYSTDNFDVDYEHGIIELYDKQRSDNYENN